jgi:hypothetical protein
MRGRKFILVTSVTAIVIANCALFFVGTDASAYVGHRYLYELSGRLKSVSGATVNPDGEEAFVASEREGEGTGPVDSPGAVTKFGPLGLPANFLATESYIEGSLLTGTGEPGGSFAGEGNSLAVPRGVAVDASSGDIYVSQDPYIGVGGVAVFGSSGEYKFELAKIPPTAAVPGPIVGPRGLAIDQSTHELYVLDNGGKQIGNGIAGNFVVDVFNTNGEYESQIPLGEEHEEGGDLAVDESSGRIYVGVRSRVLVFSHTGVLEATWTGSGTPTGSLEIGSGIAVDQKTHNVYVTGSRNPSSVYELNQSGEYVTELTETEGTPFESAEPEAVAANGDVYIAERSQIYVFGPGVLLPDVTTGGSAGATSVSAAVTGSVNPDGVAVSACAFKYGLTSSYGLSAPCSPSPGSGSGVVTVEADLAQLEPNARYHYQLSATNENGSNFGEDATFATAPAEPVVGGESTPAVGPREALLSATVNPENSDTSYRFVYGPTSGYGLSVPVSNVDIGSSFGPLHVVKSVMGLQAGVTYHYAVVATNQSGTVYGPDETFTATAPSPPVVSTGGVVELTQNGVVLSGVVDAMGAQTGYEFDLGTDTAYGTRAFGNAGSGTEAETFTASFQSLEPGTTYHYRLVATNTYGTSYGADGSFTTPGFPTAVLGAPSSLPLVSLPSTVFPAAVSVRATPKAKAKAKLKKKARPKEKAKAKKKVRKSSNAKHARRAQHSTRGRTGSKGAK